MKFPFHFVVSDWLIIKNFFSYKKHQYSRKQEMVKLLFFTFCKNLHYFLNYFKIGSPAQHFGNTSVSNISLQHFR